MIENILHFKQFGYVQEKITDTHSIGRCPLCGKAGHFHINIKEEGRPWDCKSCGQSGGFQKFLQAAMQISDKSTAALTPLAKSRGLSVETLKLLGVGVLGSKYLIPVFSSDKKTILNVKIYDGDSFHNTAGCQAHMYGLWKIPAKYQFVFVAEGEWDYMAILEIDPDDSAIIGAPGAGTFKPEAVLPCTGKIVYLLYDNDEAGQNGSKKAKELLISVAADVYTLRWPKGTKTGYDIRDLYKSKGREKTMKFILDNSIALSDDDKKIGAPTETEGAEVITNKEVYSIYKKWLHLETINEIDFVFGCIIANRIPGDPVWAFLVGPPGAYKTELLRSLAGGSRIHFESNVSRAALISGVNFGNADPSLIKLFNGKMVIIKDMSPLLTKNSEEFDEIMSIFREVYDGECTRSFSGIRRVYKSTFGILAAVTPAIEEFTETHANLGERFLRYRMWISDDIDIRKKFVERAVNNISKEKQMRLELNTIAKRVLMAVYGDPPEFSTSEKEWIVNISQWLVILRGYVSRDRYSKDSLHRPFTELATRVSKELTKLASGIALFRGEDAISDHTKSIIKNVALSSITQRLFITLEYLYKEGKKSTGDITKHVRLSHGTVEMLLGNLELLNAAEKMVEDNKSNWQLTESFRKLTKSTGVL